jgi:hypothetical protein
VVSLLVGVVVEIVVGIVGGWGGWGGWCFAWDLMKGLRLSCFVNAFG